MALKEIPGDLSGTKGTVETIQIVPNDVATVLKIVSILYGTNAAGPVAVPVNADGKSFDLAILPGNNLLQVTLFSPNPVDGLATAQELLGGVVTILKDDIEFVGGVAVWSPEILGA